MIRFVFMQHGENTEEEEKITIATDGDPENPEDILEMARKIAERAHANQFDKGGHPYMEHINAVVDGVEGAELKTIAYLHDTMEDCGITAEQLRKCFPDRIVETIELMTRKQGMSYGEYIKQIMNNKKAIAVKMSDMRNNMDLSRILNPTEEDFSRVKKYKKHYKRLEERYQDICDFEDKEMWEKLQKESDRNWEEKMDEPLKVTVISQPDDTKDKK